MQIPSSGAVNGAQHLPIDRSNRLGDLAAGSRPNMRRPALQREKHFNTRSRPASC